MNTKLRRPSVLGENDAHNSEQHRLLGLALDPLTTRHLAGTGVGPGWRCLEVGAGDGGVAAWLARRVAPSGSVLATDIRPVPMPAVEGLEFALHDIVRDPLPEAEFDLVHVRLVLRLLPERLAVLDRLVRSLEPGGVLRIDEFDATDAPALSVPDPAAHDLYRAFLDAKAQIMTAGNVDMAWGSKAARAMRRAGLTGVSAHCHYEEWCAGSPGLPPHPAPAGPVPPRRDDRRAAGRGARAARPPRLPRPLLRDLFGPGPAPGGGLMTAPRIDLPAVAPDVYGAMANLTKAASAHLDPLLAELVRIRVSQINGCAFCLRLHTRAALDAGENETRLHELASWRDSTLFTAAERAALALAEAMTSLGPAGVADEVFTAAREHFAETPLAHLLWTIAAINAWNRIGITVFPPK